MSQASKPSSAPDDPHPPVKRRRGRQPRPSLLKDRVKAAVREFAEAVGQPKVIEPAGFRDFRGWLAFISGSTADHFWPPLVDAVLHDCNNDLSVVNQIKRDLVREIVQAVVIPRQGESSKLVSTNCGRQCARPAAGLTLMTILDRVFSNLHYWRNPRTRHPHVSTPTHPPQAHQQYPLRITATSAADNTLRSSPAHSSSASRSSRYPNALPPVGRLLSNQPAPSRNASVLPHHSAVPQYPRPSASRDDRRAGSSRPADHRHSHQLQQQLPSFRELEDSLQPPLNLKKRTRH